MGLINKSHATTKPHSLQRKMDENTNDVHVWVRALVKDKKMNA